MRGTHQIPTTSAVQGAAAVAYGRQFARLVGPGFQAPDGSLNAADFLGWGGFFRAATETNNNSIRNAFLSSAVELLSELEDRYGLPVNPPLSTAQRQQRLVAKMRARFEGTPQAILSTVRVYDSTAAIYESSSIIAAAAGDPREVFRFALTVTASTWTQYRVDIIRAVSQQKPAHTTFAVGTRFGFRTDDPLSLTDRDFLGA